MYDCITTKKCEAVLQKPIPHVMFPYSSMVMLPYRLLNKSSTRHDLVKHQIYTSRVSLGHPERTMQMRFPPSYLKQRKAFPLEEWRPVRMHTVTAFPKRIEAALQSVFTDYYILSLFYDIFSNFNDKPLKGISTAVLLKQCKVLLSAVLHEFTWFIEMSRLSYFD